LLTPKRDGATAGSRAPTPGDPSASVPQPTSHNRNTQGSRAGWAPACAGETRGLCAMGPPSGWGTPVPVTEILNRVPGLACPRENGEPGIHILSDWRLPMGPGSGTGTPVVWRLAPPQAACGPKARTRAGHFCPQRRGGCPGASLKLAHPSHDEGPIPSRCPANGQQKSKGVGHGRAGRLD
jgi:hypothetical protein